MYQVGTAHIFTPQECAPWIYPPHINTAPRYDTAGPGSVVGLYSGRSHQDVASEQPGYGFDASQVRDLTEDVHEALGEAVFDEMNLRIHVMPFESRPSFNGATYMDTDWHDEKKTHYGVIVLYGRPTPIPRQTCDYVTVHEIGHAFQGTFAEDGTTSRIDNAYWLEWVERRALPKVVTRPKRWHEQAVEVFADDFRCALFGGEWNHEDIEPTPDWTREWLYALPTKPHGDKPRE